MPLSEVADVTLQVGDQKGGTESLLRAAGALDGLPYKVAFSTFTSGPPQVEAATAGKIDFAITGNTPPIFGAASNAKVKVVSAYDGGGTGDQVLVHADSPITTIADLRGKRIAVGKGSSAHGHILAQLKNAGLTPADVQLVFLQPADALSAFTAGRGRRVGDLGSLHRAGRRAAPGPQHRPGHATSPTATGSASPPTRRWPTRSAIPRCRTAWFASRRRRAGQRTIPSSGRRATPRRSGLDLKVAEVAQSRSVRLPTELDDERGGLGAEDRRPVRRVRSDRLCTRSFPTGSTAATTRPSGPCCISTN